MLTSLQVSIYYQLPGPGFYISLSLRQHKKSCELISRFLLWLKSGLFSPLCYSYLEDPELPCEVAKREQNFSIYQMRDSEADIFQAGSARRTRLRSCNRSCQLYQKVYGIHP